MIGVDEAKAGLDAAEGALAEAERLALETGDVASVEAAITAKVRAEIVLRLAQRRAHEAATERDRAERSAKLAELDAMRPTVTRKAMVETIRPALDRLVSIEREACEVVSAIGDMLEEHNQRAHAATMLARNLGVDVDAPAIEPEWPALLSRILIGRNLDAVAYHWITPLDRPYWASPETDKYDSAADALKGG